MIDEIKSLEKKHNKVCEKIEQLNEEAFQLEKDLLYIKVKKAKQHDGKQ